MSEALQVEEQELDINEEADRLFAEAYAEAGGHSEPEAPPEKAEEPFGDEFVEEPVAEETTEQVEEEPETDEAPDIWADATPAQAQAYAELQQKAAKLEHTAYSNSGRVSALQKKLNELEAQVQRQSQAKQQQPEQQASPQETAEETEGFDLNSFKEDFPDVYAAMTVLQKRELQAVQDRYESKLQAIEERIGSVSAPIQQLEEEKEHAYRASQMEALTAAHPDWRDVSSSGEFQSWLEQQSQGIQQLIGSTAAEDNIVLLNLYKHGSVAQQAPQPAPQPRVVRQAQPAIPRTASAGRPQGGIHPNDEEAAWNYWSEHFNEL